MIYKIRFDVFIKENQNKVIIPNYNNFSVEDIYSKVSSWSLLDYNMNIFETHTQTQLTLIEQDERSLLISIDELVNFNSV